MRGTGIQELRMALDCCVFAEYVGERLHRRKITPDPWQRGVLVSTARRKILNTSRQVGKSTIIATLILHKALFSPGALCLIFSPTEKQAKEVFAKVSRFYLAYSGDKAAGPRNRRMRRAVSFAPEVRRMGLNLVNGSRVLALPATENSARGYDPDILVVDEAAFAKDAFYSAILPSLAVSGGDLVLASTPNGQRGFFYDEWVNGEGFARFEVPWHECARIDHDFIEREQRRRPARVFRQEYLCSFEETEGVVFNQELIDAAFDNDLQPLWED
jgi:hypothetical protein